MNILREIRNIDRSLEEGRISFQEAADRVEPFKDAEPVRHAHWVYYKNMGYFCSACIESGLSPTNADDNCGYSLDGTMNYCWNCGAKMDEVTDNG